MVKALGYNQKAVKSNPSKSKLPQLGHWLNSLNCSVVSSPNCKTVRVIANIEAGHHFISILLQLLLLACQEALFWKTLGTLDF